MHKIIGIDLGRTKCCVSVMEGGKPVIIPDRDGCHMTPSSAAWKKNGKKLIGEAAKRQAGDNLAGTVFAIKENIETGRNVTIQGELYSPQELTAILFQKLKHDAESYLGSQVEEAVLTIPSYFNEIQKQAVRDAGRISGLKINRFITGPSAAALSYYLKEKKDQKLLVCDVGNSGFDVSVIETGDGVVEILSSGSDKHLGGNALDEMLIYHMLSDFREKEGVDLAADSTALYRLREGAEQAKKTLSSAVITHIYFPGINTSREGSRDLEMDITRSQFEKLAAGQLDRMAALIEDVIRDTYLKKEDIDRVLLVGGGAQIPALRRKIQFITEKILENIPNADRCMAEGAGILGGKLAGEWGTENIILFDILHHSLYVTDGSGKSTTLIKKNTNIPVRRSIICSSFSGIQSAVNIPILQGNGELPDNCAVLGRLCLDGIHLGKKDVWEIEIGIDVDSDGRIEVSAREKESGKESHMAIDEDLCMSESEVERSRKHIGRYEAETSGRQENIAEDASKRESGIGQSRKKICPKCRLLFVASREFCSICGNRLVDKNE